MQTESYDCIEAALVFAAESGEWDITTSDTVTDRPSKYTTVVVDMNDLDMTDDDAVYSALDRGVSLDVVLALAACKS